MAVKKIISPMGWGSGAYLIHKLLESHIPHYSVSSYNPYWTFFPFALKKVTNIDGASLIHTSPDYGIFFHKKNIPLVITFHGYSLDRWLRKYSSFVQNIHCATDLRLFSMLTVKQSAAITAVSHYIADLARKDLNIRKPIRVIYNGVDTDKFSPAKNYHSTRAEVRVFFSGNLKRRKGVQWLPDITKKLNKGIRILYTSGLRTKDKLVMNKKLQSIGNVPFEGMPDRYRQMDILLMPTVREGFGLSVAEAMSCGLPVVASDCSSLPELIDDGKGGFLCRVGDVDSFAEKINLLAENPSLRKEMGAYNRAKVEKMFRLDQMIIQYKQLFEEILDNRN